MKVLRETAIKIYNISLSLYKLNIFQAFDSFVASQNSSNRTGILYTAYRENNKRLASWCCCWGHCYHSWGLCPHCSGFQEANAPTASRFRRPCGRQFRNKKVERDHSLKKRKRQTKHNQKKPSRKLKVRIE